MLWGIRHLFVKEQSGKCARCHSPDGSKYDVAAAKRFPFCGDCHTAPSYPDWLTFDQPGKLAERKSYYQPNTSKARAALLRAIDGTMPPGASPHDVLVPPGTEGAVGWCEEIIDVYQQWLNAGMPQ
jgi:hypothetical protein